MHPVEPIRSHAPELYQTIVREHDASAERLGARLQQLGWSLRDAAWVAVHWPLLSLAAAVAHEREARGLAPAQGPGSRPPEGSLP